MSLARNRQRDTWETRLPHGDNITEFLSKVTYKGNHGIRV